VTPVIAVVALWRGAVGRAGASAGAAVGLCIAWGAGWAGVGMLGTLLLLGTLASDRRRRGRGALQVLCNGAAAAVAAVCGAQWGAVACAGALATALSDTAAGELGQRFGGRARALLLGPPVPAGADGGMSPVGTLAGVVAALPVPLAGWGLGAPFDGTAVLAVAGAAVLGNLLDSVVGLAFQRGLGPRGNDWTNLVATTAGAAAAVLLAA
jgi:uncharacterized protein (TIGR00297 family)